MPVRSVAVSLQRYDWLVLDGGAPILLDGNFQEDWGDCLWLEPVLHRGQREKLTCGAVSSGRCWTTSSGRKATLNALD